MIRIVIAVASLAVFATLPGCAAFLPDLEWRDNCTPEILNQPGDSDLMCRFWLPRSAVIVLPVEARAHEIWRAEATEMETRPFAGDVIAVVGSDAAGGFTYPSKRTIARDTGLSGDALWRRALRNTDAFARTAELSPSPDGRFWVDSEPISAAALVFAESFWERDEFARFAGLPLLSLGGRSFFWVIDSARPGALELLGHGRDGCGYSSNYPGFCSRAGHVFMRSHDGTWSVVNDAALPPHACALLDEYDSRAAAAVTKAGARAGVDADEWVAQYRSELQCGDDASRLERIVDALRADLRAR